MTLEEAYAKLGLEPLDDFIQRRIADNIEHWRSQGLQDLRLPIPNSQKYRQIGATTWMAVRICLHLETQRNALVTAPFLHQSYNVMLQVAGFMERLGHPVAKNGHQSRSIAFEKAGTVYNSSNQSLPTIPHPYFVFDEEIWTQRTILRNRGPFYMIQSVHMVGGHFYAKDEDFIKIMELTEDGVKGLLVEDPLISCIGFRIERGEIIPLNPLFDTVYPDPR